MANLLADVQKISSPGQELACKRVPQIMEPDRTKPCLFKYLLEIQGLHVIDAYEATRVASEDPLRDFVLPFS